MVAECEHCGAAYAAEQWPDGKIRPIGRIGCRCGQTSFAVMREDVTRELAVRTYGNDHGFAVWLRELLDDRLPDDAAVKK